VRRAYLLDPAPNKVGRLVFNGPEILNHRVHLSFSVDSKETHPNGQYEIKVDAVTLETDCCCQWHVGRRRTPDGVAKYGPVNLLKPNHLCHHLTRVAAWVKRKKKILKEQRKTAIEANRIMAQQRAA